jgi:signal transduction histidine kinase
MIVEQVSEQLPSQLIPERSSVLALIGGLVLMVAVSVAMSLIFRHLTIQYRITHLYDNFIANVTHELKSPLASIQLYLETLNSRNVSHAKEQEFLQIMMKDTERLQSLINTILNISGLEQNKYVFNYEVVTAGPAFNKLMRETSVQFKLPAEAITIRENAPCRCVIDLNAMRIVLDNLTDNALKYSSATPDIFFAISCTEKHVVLEFRDTGIGIAHNDQNQVFNKFFRIHRSDIPSVKGTGLGLFWVKEIVKTHGGKIQVRSEGRGKGTSFFIELPIYRTTKRRYINRLLKITQNVKRVRDESEKTHDQPNSVG